MELNRKQSEMFPAPICRKPRKKIMTHEHRLLMEAYNNNPTMTINRAPKSMQKGASDTPLFKPRNQHDLF